VITSHVEAFHRAGVDTECAEDALAIINFEAIDAEPFSERVLFLFDVDAIDRAGTHTFIAGNACGEIEAVKPAIARRYSDWLLRIFVLFGEWLRAIGSHDGTHSHPHTREYRENSLPDVVEPRSHEISIGALGNCQAPTARQLANATSCLESVICCLLIT